MASIGSFKRDGEGFAGTVATLTLTAKVTFRPVQADNEKGPGFRLFAGKTEIGAGWAKTSREGKAYISCKLDDPSFVAPIYCSLTEDSEAPGQHTLIWSRRQAD